MGIWSYLIHTNEVAEVSHENEGFSTTKFVMVVGIISLLLFGIGYVLRPVSEIVDELHDSDGSDSDNSDSDSDIEKI